MAIISNGTTIISGGSLQVGAGAADLLFSATSSYTAGTVVDLDGYKSAKLHVQWNASEAGTMQPEVYLITTNVNTGGTGASVGTGGWSYYTRTSSSNNSLSTTNYTYGTSPIYAGMNSGTNSGWVYLKLMELVLAV